MEDVLVSMAKLLVNEEMLRNISATVNRISPGDKELVETMRTSQLKNFLRQKLWISNEIVSKILDRSELKELTLATINDIEQKEMAEFMKHYIQNTINEYALYITAVVVIVSIVVLFPERIYYVITSTFALLYNGIVNTTSGLLYMSKTKTNLIRFNLKKGIYYGALLMCISMMLVSLIFNYYQFSTITITIKSIPNKLSNQARCNNYHNHHYICCYILLFVRLLLLLLTPLLRKLL